MELQDRHYTDVTFLACSGGRTDHALFNWMLVLQQDWSFRCRVVDHSMTASLVHSDCPFDEMLAPNTLVSLLPRESVAGVTTAGLVYPLSDARLMGGRTLGLSNEVVASSSDSTDQSVRVSVTSGRLLVCVVHPN